MKGMKAMNKTSQAVILGIMCFILTIGICVQIKTVNSTGTTTSSNQELNNLKSQVLKTKEKYEASYEKLERVQEELEKTRNNVASNDEQLRSLEEQIKKYNTLLGASQVTGPGVTITVADAVVQDSLLSLIDPIVHDVDILEIVNELKNAGAEAIDVNGQRITANTSISCDGNVIVVNGEKISSPFIINAIGLPERMATLNRPGGYLSKMEESYIKTTFNKSEKITIQKYIGGTSFKYAKAVK